MIIRCCADSASHELGQRLGPPRLYCDGTTHMRLREGLCV